MCVFQITNNQQKMNSQLTLAAKLLKSSVHTTAFTGAGISVESGIPPFRGPNGLWSKYDPKILDIEYFKTNGPDAWEAINKLFYDFFNSAQPNAAHKALAKLEQMGIVKGIITQNIDNLHQEAGSKKIWEYHGNYRKLICMKCKTEYEAKNFDLSEVPLCKNDNSILKPNFVFFGESIPEKASAASFHEASVADVFLLIGTTGEVMPANLVPRLAKQNGAKIIEVNPEPSSYTNEITDIFLEGRAGEILPALVENISQ